MYKLYYYYFFKKYKNFLYFNIAIFHRKKKKISYKLYKKIFYINIFYKALLNFFLINNKVNMETQIYNNLLFFK